MLLILCFFTMYLLKLFLIFFSSSYIIGNDICILTDRKNITIHCINNFFENTKYLTKNDTNVTLYELNDEGGMYIIIIIYNLVYFILRN